MGKASSDRLSYITTCEDCGYSRRIRKTLWLFPKPAPRCTACGCVYQMPVKQGSKPRRGKWKTKDQVKKKPKPG